ncbi:SGNH/GDSL hydrolase family protein [Alienimonas chondri]|uniref:SGNH hydrolase-type esterase domain-containing protein n=1 Tax=Alienimonas chondri TaxID=2681879 RepID=A0ABX1VG43_9PLAN|nr:SGNH/GDSL hydrolase family protein [Alienimonas chondri]NNJ27074.1 hypothetical protein [Alienimonas chondri]
MTPLLIALLSVAPAGDPAVDADPAWLHVRGGLPQFQAALKGDDPVRVVFFGGSITEGNGYRPLVEAKLRATYPNVEFDFHNAGVSSTGSTTGVFRYLDAATGDGKWWRGMGSPEPIPLAADLVIAEAAVNDDQDERLPAADAGWGMEGIARHVHVFSDKPSLMFVHFVNPSILEAFRAGKRPVSIAAHERVAEHYAVPSVNVAQEVARRIDEGTLTWKEYGGTHPGPPGHELAAEMIVTAIERSLQQQPEGASTEEPLRDDALDMALTVPGENAINAVWGITADDAWTVGVPDWDALKGSVRGRFQDLKLLHTDDAGAVLTFAGLSPAVGLYVLAGPDAGAVEVSVPGEEPKIVQLYHEHSKGLHYPRTVLLYRSDEPAAGPVTVKVVQGDHGGTAVRIVGVGLGFITRDVVSGGDAEPDTP